MDILKHILLKIEERPNMYLGAPSLKKLDMFICGFFVCLELTNPEQYKEAMSTMQAFVNACNKNGQKEEVEVNVFFRKDCSVDADDEKEFFNFFQAYHLFSEDGVEKA